MIGTKGHKTEERKEVVGPYLKPGITKLKVAHLEAVTSSVKKTPGIKITFEGESREELNGAGQTMDDTLYLTEKSMQYSMARLGEIAEAVGVREQIDAIQESETQNYINKVLPLIRGKFFRCKINGEEVEGREGKNNWFKAKLPFRHFAESLDVAESESRLRFNKDDAYDMKRLPTVEQMASMPQPGNTDGDDLPF